jgi:hypothetical protein
MFPLYRNGHGGKKKQKKGFTRMPNFHYYLLIAFYVPNKYNETMFQESEIITLVVAVVGAFLSISVFAKRKVVELRYFYIGFFAIVAASFFTVIEGVFWKDLFNLLEHLCYALAGLSFIVGCNILLKQSQSKQEDQ